MQPPYPLWLALAGLFAACAFWHVRQNFRLSQQWQRYLDRNSAAWMTRFAWSRSVQFLLALACCIAALIAYDRELRKPQEIKLSVSSVAAPGVSTVAGRTVQEPAKPAADGYYPPEAQAPKILGEGNSAIEQIYGAGETPGDQAAMDRLKTRYEGILVTYFFLERCKKVSDVDYEIIMTSLVQDMAKIKAPVHMQQDILTAAQGSYHEMYAQSDCGDVNTTSLKAQYASYLVAISGTGPAK